MRLLGVKARLVKQCGLCGSRNLRPVLQLGASPPTCSMAPVEERPPSETHHPLDLLFCDECGLAQLSVVVDPAAVFPVDYPYRSGHSKALHENFEDLAAQVGPLEPEDLVVDIGANDGTLLSKFDGCRKIGVEPTEQVRHTQADFVYRAFFDRKVAERIVADHSRAKVVTACNVLAHVENIDEVMQGIDILLADDGVLVAENHDLASVVDGGQWDTVYHEHLRFWDPHSFDTLLDKYGLGLRHYRPIATHGGSFRMIASKGLRSGWVERRSYDFKALALSARQARASMRGVTMGGPLAGIGATARATTIINYCGLDVEDIECVCEVAGSDKIGRYIPGTRIPVVDESHLFDTQQDAVLFSWHMADLIVPKLRQRGYHGEIVVPLPSVQTYRPAVAA